MGDSNLVFIGGKSWRNIGKNLDCGTRRSDGPEGVALEKQKLRKDIKKNTDLFLLTIIYFRK